MCRFVAYLGQATTLERVISVPEHSLVVQSYRPGEMTSGVVNADGFGVGWYNRALDPTPCVYTNLSPIWSDRNLPGLSRHIASQCIFANVAPAPSLYYATNTAFFPQAAVIASERLFVSPDWSTVPDGSMVACEAGLDLQLYDLRYEGAA